MSRKTRVAAVQMAFGPDVASNLATMEQAIKRLARRKANIAIFPECCLNGYLIPAENRDWKATAAGVDSLRALARDKKMALIFGLAERNGKELPLNSSFAVDGRGKIVARYSKQHLISWDHEYFSPGARRVKVFKLASLKVAMQVCYDLRFPEPARAAAIKGAQLICYSLAASGSGAWKKPVMEGHLRSRAAENGVYAVAANRFEKVMMMNSRIVTPDGLDLAKAPMDRAAEIIAEITPRAADHKHLQDRRGDLYPFKSR
jgi:deaminated glutathione amidase